MVAACATFAMGCGETSECRQLTSLAKQYETASQETLRMAEVHDRLEKRAKARESEAVEFMAKLGLEDSETAIASKLEARAKAIGGEIERHGQVPTGTGVGTLRKKSTYWQVNYDASSLAEGFATAWKLAESPPLVVVDRIVRSRDGKKWRVDLARALVDRVPIEPKPRPLPSLIDPADIDAEMGFCGARELRSRIAKLKAQIEEARPKAEAMTVLMPTEASWVGLKMRSEKVEEVELESRRLMKLFIDGVVKTNAPFTAIAAEDPEVILEVAGGPKDRKRLEEALAAESSNLKDAMSPEQDKFRMSLKNTKMMQGRGQRPGGSIPPLPVLPK